MPTYKLTYFNVRARAETARMLFKLAGVDFEDVRVTGEEWAKLKPTTPLGQLPMLEVDGEVLSQSNAINRFLAREFGFAGKTPMEQARVDMIIDSIDGDVSHKGTPIFGEKDPEKKAALQKAFVTDALEPMCAKLEKLLAANSGDFLVGNELTMADLVFYNFMGFYCVFAAAPALLEAFPGLKALQARVEAVPQIQAWIAERPQTDF